MEQQSPPPQSTLTEVHAHLHAIAELLRRPAHLDQAARAALADLVEELDKALNVGSTPSDEVVRLTASASHLADAIRHRKESGVLSAARDRLDEAIVAAETNAPMLASLTRQFMDALSNIGI